MVFARGELAIIFIPSISHSAPISRGPIFHAKTAIPAFSDHFISLCRLVITVLGCIIKIILIPFKYILGGRPSGGHCKLLVLFCFTPPIFTHVFLC